MHMKTTILSLPEEEFVNPGNQGLRRLRPGHRIPDRAEGPGQEHHPRGSSELPHRSAGALSGCSHQAPLPERHLCLHCRGIHRDGLPHSRPWQERTSRSWRGPETAARPTSGSRHSQELPSAETTSCSSATTTRAT
ncbi:MAG: hypothetical protein MZU91_02815 [Desulfosudis oleivorans]|nr:hypothetical protein [Desulfosudis oleivorans]